MGEAYDHFPEENWESASRHSEENLGDLLDRCGHCYAHRIGCSRRGRSNIMAVIAQRPGITQKELAEVLGVQPASVSELLIKLERKGFVRREKAEQDRRSVCVTLTETGQQHLNRPEEGLSAPFQVLSGEEQAQLAGLLKKLLLDWQRRYPAEQAGRYKHKNRHAVQETDHREEKYEF